MNYMMNMKMNTMISMRTKYAKLFLDPMKIKNVNFHLSSEEQSITHVSLEVKDHNLGAQLNWTVVRHIYVENGVIVTYQNVPIKLFQIEIVVKT